MIRDLTDAQLTENLRTLSSIWDPDQNLYRKVSRDLGGGLYRGDRLRKLQEAYLEELLLRSNGM